MAGDRDIQQQTPKPVLDYGVDTSRAPWKRELARDFLACGSWVFYILIVGRAMIAPYRPFTDQLLIAAVLLLAITWFYRRYDGYLARGTILAVSLVPFYDDTGFTVFIGLAFTGLILSASYLSGDFNRVFAGLIIGAVCIAAAFVLALLTENYILPDLGRIPAHREDAAIWRVII